MDIARLSALTRSGYASYPRSAPGGRVSGTDTALSVTRQSQPPVEYVVQGEVLEKRRGNAADAGFQLLDTLRGMEQAWRHDAAPTDATAGRDTRRAIASYTAQAAPTAATVARFIDAYV